MRETINHLRLSARPDKTHLSCRHKRWGASYELCFEIAAALAIRNPDELLITNNPIHTERELRKVDTLFSMKEYPGAFYFKSNLSEILVCGDGRILHREGSNIWIDYMAGVSSDNIASDFAGVLGLTNDSDEAGKY